MYSFYDEKAKIREIQKYLFVTESGNMDDKTLESIIAVQKKNGLEANGRIDYETFNFIYDEYRKKEEKEAIRRLYPEVEFPIRIGSYNTAMWEVNKMLLAVSDFYGISTNLRYNNYYGERSERILEEVFSVYGIERRSGEIDVNAYRLLEKDFQMIRNRGD